MEENKFFRFVWRFNAIVIMASAVLTLASLIFVVGDEISRRIDRQNTSIVNVDRNAEIAEELEIDTYRQVEGTPYLISLENQSNPAVVTPTPVSLLALAVTSYLSTVVQMKNSGYYQTIKV